MYIFLWYNYINLSFFFYYLFVCHKYYKYIMQIDHIPLPSLCITIIHSCCYVKFSNYTVSYYNQHFFFSICIIVSLTSVNILMNRHLIEVKSLLYIM